jgi:hypothetical protein
MTGRLAIVVAAMLAALPASAADVKDLDSGPVVIGGYAFDHVIMVSGGFEEGDADKFLAATSGLSRVLVDLDSSGGLLNEGIDIGREIRVRQFATDVAPNRECLSACAFAWLAGTPRIADRSAVILFHHPWVIGNRDWDAAASAVLGAYLNSLGLSDKTIFFMTEKGKDEGNYLTEEIAEAYGIETVFTGEIAAENQQVAATKLVRGAKLLHCRLDRRVPYAGGDLCTEATAESITEVDVPPLYCGAWVPGYGNEFGAPTDRDHGAKIDCGVNPRARLQ